jgi:hypothetical protein
MLLLSRKPLQDTTTMAVEKSGGRTGHFLIFISVAHNDRSLESGNFRSVPICPTRQMNMNAKPQPEQSVQEEQIRVALTRHWQASAAGDANAEHDIYDDDGGWPRLISEKRLRVPHPVVFRVRFLSRA